METCKIDKAGWNMVKTRFLRSFKQKYSPQMVFANLQDLMQKPGEAVFGYFAGNMETFKWFLASKPDDMLQATAAVAN